MRRLLPVLTLSSLVLASTACAPVYAPSAASLSMLEQPGDGHLGVMVGSMGWQVDGATAVGEQVAIRGTAQALTDVSVEGSRYTLGSVGAHWFRAWHREGGAAGGRLALGGEVGLAPARGDYQSSRYSGLGVRTALVAEVGYEAPYASAGLLVRPVYLHFLHDRESTSAEPSADYLLAESVAVLRAGGEHVKAQLQGGLMLPFAGRGDIGVPLPVIVGFGITGDIPGERE